MRPGFAAAMLLAACGGRESGAPAAHADLYAALCAARGMPEQPTHSPRQHLHAVGTVEFGIAGESARQRAELWLGGPARMRFMASAENGARNVFLVDGPGSGWLSPARDPKKWEVFHSPEVERETLLRWELLRFPWGWREQIEAGGDEVRAWTRRDAEGEIVIEVGADLLPCAGSYAGVEVSLEQWTPADDAPLRVARRWAWSGPSGVRTEQYHQLGAQWLLFNEWYRPPTADGLPDRSFRAVGGTVGFELLSATLWICAEAPAAPDQSGLQWWLREGERVAAVLLAADSPPPASLDGRAPAAEGHRAWLRWTFVGTGEDARKAVSEVSEIARSAGLQALGPPLVSEPERAVNSITILLPVSAPPPSGSER